MRHGNLLTNFLVIRHDGQAIQSPIVDFRRESQLASNEARLGVAYQHQYRITGCSEDRHRSKARKDWKYIALIEAGFVWSNDHDLPCKGKRVFAYSFEEERFYEVFWEGAKEVPIREKLLSASFNRGIIEWVAVA
jgi:hypothetical protein